MVLVEDVTDSAENNTSRPSGSSTSSTSETRSSTSNTNNSSTTTNTSSFNLVNFLMQDKISAVLLFTRVYTIACTILFILPLFRFDVNVLYSKALMSSAATSALKLHQRMTNVPFQLSREYFGRLMLEDSFHYLFYSLIFLNSHPITIVLMPIAAFATLHVSAYIKTILSAAGASETAGGLLRRPLNAVLARDKDIMRFVAVCEIMLAPIILLMIFSGKTTLFMPFVYYRFVCMRYSSRRNPYNRAMFHELRLALETMTSQASCPQLVKNLGDKLINLVIRFAPQQYA